MNKLIIELSGDIPSKKNSRITLRNGRTIPSKRFQVWHDIAIVMTKLAVQKQIKTYSYISNLMSYNIDITFYMGTKRRTDIDNKVSSILDMLVDAGVLEDDDWTHVPSIQAHAVYRKSQPGATITISQTVL